MSQDILPYLQSLRSSLATLSNALDTDPELARRCAAISGSLLDRMIVDHKVAATFRTEYYAAFAEVLPTIERTLPDQLQDCINELRAICVLSEVDAESFERFQQLVGEIHNSLLEQSSLQAAALCKSVAQMETDYCRQLDQARSTQSIKAIAAAKGATGARNARAIDEKALLDFIRETCPQESALGIAEIRSISGGFSKITSSIALSNAQFLPANIILRGDAAATYGGASVVDEYRLLKALHEQGIRVPKPLALEASGKVFGSPFMLVEKRSGSPMGHMFDLPTQANKPLLDDVAENLAAIHRVPLTTLDQKMEGASTRSSEKMLAWIDEATNNWLPLNMPSPVFATALEWLRRNARLNDMAPRTLVHGDYSLHNFLVENNKISAILDWEFAHVGNPAYDLGYFYFMARSLSSWDDFLHVYGNAGMPIPDEDQLNYHVLLASTRLGVMVCQSVKAFTTGMETGLAATISISGGYYEETIMRISNALDRVL